ncbi:hypothetical protein VTK73DRAFT_9177 [Phialemonium thermophilum]|uniref:Uncharacterized protein n=1 Tax=Phialemonium thermophilum TaxID=223376 RepID=A0ABR3W407_9PEZI
MTHDLMCYGMQMAGRVFWELVVREAWAHPQSPVCFSSPLFFFILPCGLFVCGAVYSSLFPTTWMWRWSVESSSRHRYLECVIQTLEMQVAEDVAHFVPFIATFYSSIGSLYTAQAFHVVSLAAVFMYGDGLAAVSAKITVSAIGYIASTHRGEGLEVYWPDSC